MNIIIRAIHASHHEPKPPYGVVHMLFPATGTPSFAPYYFVLGTYSGSPILRKFVSIGTFNLAVP